MLKIPARFKQCDLSVSLAFDYCDCIVNMGTRAAACKHQNIYYLPNNAVYVYMCQHLSNSIIRSHIYMSLYK